MSTDKLGARGLYSPSEGFNGGILEQAWMMKMAQEIKRKVEEENKDARKWEERRRSSSKRREASTVGSGRSEDGVLGDAPPAYAF